MAAFSSSSSSSSYSYSYSYSSRSSSSSSSSSQASTRTVTMPVDAFDRFVGFAPRKAITQNSFMKVAQVIMMGSSSSDEDIIEAFHILDADGSGQLDLGELAKVIPAIIPGTDLQTLGQTIQQYDANFDNQISLQEFINLVKGGLAQNIVFRDVLTIEYATIS